MNAEGILNNDVSLDNTADISSDDIFEATFGNKIRLSENQKDQPLSFSQELEFNFVIEEAHLIREQLKWLLAMSEKMPKILKETQF